MSLASKPRERAISGARRLLGTALAGIALTCAPTALAETSHEPETVETGRVGQATQESGYDALAWAGWAAWAALMVLVSLQFRRQRQLARDIARLENIIGALEQRSANKDEEKER